MGGGGGQGGCERRIEVFSKGGGQGGCERRIKVFVKIKKKKIFFWGGGGGGGGGGLVGGGGVGSGWVRVDVNEELKFCENSKKKKIGGGDVG